MPTRRGVRQLTYSLTCSTARVGNMRQVREHAALLRERDPAYAAFANRLDTLAQGYHSKQLAAFVTRYRAENVVPPL